MLCQIKNKDENICGMRMWIDACFDNLCFCFVSFYCIFGYTTFISHSSIKLIKYKILSRVTHICCLCSHYNYYDIDIDVIFTKWHVITHPSQFRYNWLLLKSENEEEINQPITSTNNRNATMGITHNSGFTSTPELLKALELSFFDCALTAR